MVINKIWKPIIGYEGLYKISNYGEIKSLNYGRTKREKIMSPNKDTDGYLLISLSKEGSVKKHKIHQLVLIHFVGRKPFSEAVCRHLNGEPGDNAYFNLQWSTKSDNQKDRVRHGTISTNLQTRDQRGSKNNMVRLICADIPEIRKLSLEGMSDLDISKIYNVSKGCIYGITHNINWKYIK